MKDMVEVTLPSERGKRTKASDQRIAVFIDVQNMFYSTYKLYRGRLRYGQLLDFVVAGRKVFQATAYVVEQEGKSQRPFKVALADYGYRIKSKMLTERSDGSRKGDWDMGIALDVVKCTLLAPRVDVIALVTGDGDFTDLAHLLVENNFEVEVYSYEDYTAMSLKRVAKFFEIPERVVFQHEDEEDDEYRED